MKKSFKITNPLRADQTITQEVTVSDKLQFDYSESKWIAVDTEFLSYNLYQDTLCTIQICSEDPENSEKLRVEIVHVYKKEVDKNLVDLFENESILKIFHAFQADMPRIELYLDTQIRGEIFDTKLAARIALTNLDGHSMQKLVKYLVDPNFQENKNATSSEWDDDPEMWEEDQFKYAAEDVIYLYEMRKKILKVAKRRGKLELVEGSMKLLPGIAALYKAGFESNIFNY